MYASLCLILRELSMNQIKRGRPIKMVSNITGCLSSIVRTIVIIMRNSELIGSFSYERR